MASPPPSGPPAPTASRWRRFWRARYFDDPRYNERPSFGTVVRTYRAAVASAAVAAISMKLTYELWESSGDIPIDRADPALWRPYQENPIPFPIDVVYSGVLPFSTIALASLLWIRSWWDFLNAAAGLAAALAAAMVANVGLKKFVGGPRPHFMAVCGGDSIRDKLAAAANHRRHNRRAVPLAAARFHRYAARRLCPKRIQGHAFGNLVESFPSGHSAAFFTSAAFLTCWLACKLAARPRLRPLALPVLALPLTAAAVGAGTMVRHGWHFPVDVVAGALIGLLVGTAAYWLYFDGCFPRLVPRKEEEEQEDKDKHKAKARKLEA